MEVEITTESLLLYTNLRGDLTQENGIYVNTSESVTNLAEKSLVLPTAVTPIIPECGSFLLKSVLPPSKYMLIGFKRWSQMFLKSGQ
jgi:hypothetical protein